MRTPAIRYRCASLLLLALFAATAGNAADTLIATGSVWRFFANTNDQGTAWRALAFDDISWTNSGPAQLGFGDGDEATLVASNRQATTYFRHFFDVSEPGIYTNLQARLLRDDGGIVYLNGTEVFRNNMPTGAVTYATLAPAGASAADESTNFYLKYIDPTLLRSGSNLVAIEIHQNSLTSSDLSFDFALLGNVIIRPPVVAITNIVSNSFFKSGTNIVIAASASDIDDGIAKVEFFEGSTKLGEDTSSPYSITWSNVVAGTHTLFAVASDLGAITATSAPVSFFVVTNVPPTIAITNPPNMAAYRPGTNIAIGVSASDVDDALTKVEFYSDSEKLGEDAASPFSLTWSNVQVGEYSLTAIATDARGLSSTSAVVNIGVATNFAPTVSITSPTNDAVLGGPGDITIRVATSDPDGSNDLARVEYFANGAKIGEATSPFTFLWSNAALGNYTLAAIASDKGGLSTTSAPINILIQSNVSPTVTITAPTNNALVKTGTTAIVTVNAADIDGIVTRVEFFRDNQKFGERTILPATAGVSNLTAGRYVFHVVATDNAGGSTTSAPITMFWVTNFLPSVTITIPTNNASYGGPLDLTINATASDRDGSITLIEFFEGANKIGQDTTSPFSILWTNVALGAYTLTAIARDNVGLTSTSAPVAIIVKTNIPPNVSVSAPTEGEMLRVGNPITLIVTATDSDGIVRRVEFFANGDRLGEKTNAPFTLTWTNALQGAYALTAIATDTAGASSTSAPVNIVLVTNFAPTVTLTAPANNASLGGPVDVLLTATASDSDGTIARVDFFEGPNKIGDDNSSPYQFVWPNVPISNYVLTAVATDSSGASRTSAPVNFSVRTNLLPTVSITSPRTNALFNLLSNIVITANASDSDGGVRRVEFYANSARLGEATNSPYSMTWSNFSTGIQVLSAIATDIAGGSRTSAPVRISVLSNIPPIVVITNPLNNAISSLKTPLVIKVRATDVDGTITKVELFQSEYKIGELSAPPYNFPISNLYAGTYLFRARATDSYGESVFSDAVSVTLHNRHLLVPQGSAWRFLDTGVDLSNSWRRVEFDDHSWTNGPAQLGFGDGDEATVVASNRQATTYFRHTFMVTNRESFSNVFIRLLRDDGGAVYLNGTEVFRSNVSTNATNEILFSTLAPASALTEDETFTFYQATVSATNLLEGTNVVAVEIHQNSLTSSDLSFDLELSATDAIGMLRGPYLQSGTPHSLIVRWRTDGATESIVRFGTAPGALTSMVEDNALTNEHIVELTGLTPNARYYYSVGWGKETFAGGLDCTFKTSPLPGESHPTRIWVLGDSGTGDSNARSVRDAYYNFAEDRPVDLWLMLGDNAYDNGTEEEFQNALFDMFPVTLRQSVLWPIISNHDVANSTNPPITVPYFQIFSLPTNAVAGGVPSGTEKYYSFDYGDIHFVCLDSQTSLVDSNSPQYLWLEQDLAANHKNWLIATCGNPPYGHIGNDTDTMPRDLAVRTYLIPLLEAHGLDLYFAGDDHALERSYLLDGHYGIASTLTNSMIVDGGSGRPDETGAYNKHVRGPVPHRGAVYVVNGSAGHLDAAAAGHPANYITRVVLGSIILDVDDSQLQVQFLSNAGVIEDHFTLIKDNYLPVAQDATLAMLEDSSLQFSLPASDRNGDPLTYRILSVPTNGVTQIIDPQTLIAQVVTNGISFSTAPMLLYLPNTNFNGVDTLSFTATDAYVESAPGSITITVAPVNDPPVATAVALPPSTVAADNGIARVILDGSGSSDLDNDPLQFFWSEQGSLLATGKIATVNLGIGSHLIGLRVTDGSDESRTDVRVEVLSPGNVVEQISAQLAASTLAERHKRPLQSTLSAAMEAFNRSSREAGINQLNAFKAKLRAQIAPIDSMLADQLAAMAQHLIDLVSATLDKPHFHSLVQEPNRAMRLRFTGASAGQYYLIQASTNLIDWETVGVTASQSDSAIEFSDPEAPRFPHRFYRVTGSNQ